MEFIYGHESHESKIKECSHKFILYLITISTTLKFPQLRTRAKVYNSPDGFSFLLLCFICSKITQYLAWTIFPHAFR